MEQGQPTCRMMGYKLTVTLIAPLAGLVIPVTTLSMAQERTY